MIYFTTALSQAFVLPYSLDSIQKEKYRSLHDLASEDRHSNA